MKTIKKTAGLLILGLLFLNLPLTFAMDTLEQNQRKIIEQVQVFRPEVTLRSLAIHHSYEDSMKLNDPAWIQFNAKYGNQWSITLDDRSGRPNIIQGEGIPWFPGRGNKLGADYLEQYGLNPDSPLKIDFLAMKARNFISENSSLFRVDQKQLEIDQAGSFISRRYSVVRFKQVIDGIPVWKSHLFFRINNGNLIQFGAYLYENVTISAAPKLDAEEAFGVAADHVNRYLPDELGITSPIKLMIIPVAAEGDDYAAGTPFSGKNDTGYSHRLVFEIIMESPGSPYVWRALVDAHDGILLMLEDFRKYGVVDGGIYSDNNTQQEVVRPLPFAKVVNNGDKQTDKGGNYTYSGGDADCSLDGDYAEISDNCGDIELTSNTAPGDLHFGSSAGTDCTTPGVGGNGNTHSARTAFYHINWLKEKVGYYQPGIGWLDNNLLASVNRTDDWCNAYWTGVYIKFYQFHSTVNYDCGNTGEIADIILHETSHGIDSNDANGFSIDKGSGEAYADTAGFLMTHTSCIGHNFKIGVPCNYGCDAGCTGVRDVNTQNEVTVSNIENAPGDCDRWNCPYAGYMGPMGYEGHCESLIASQAWWDAVAAVRNEIGNNGGWLWADRIWYEGLSSIDAAYQLTDGGQCNPNADVDGCAADNYYTVFLGVDDDDGNLANGTPHGCRLWEHFNAHGIACDDEAPDCYSSCPSINAPQIVGCCDGSSVTLKWNNVVNAHEYIIFRNDIGCDYGWIPMHSTTSLSWNDAEIAPGITHYYIVQAVGTDDECRGPASNCYPITVETPWCPCKQNN